VFTAVLLVGPQSALVETEGRRPAARTVGVGVPCSIAVAVFGMH
jgi:hypothetical protein